MITKEFKLNRYVCFYVSEYHLEMILMPYIKEHIDSSKMIIMSQKNIEDSVKVLLDRINFSLEDKKKILRLDWKKKNTENLENFIKENKEKLCIIIIGNKKYIKSLNDIIKINDLNNVSVIDCYDVNEVENEVSEIKKEYDNMLNVTYFKNI